ncbi:hypothetical protein [Arcobacter sp.]|uniref:hypothetical protein n=1 Tax=unclassified Arcobacter TaxID=2593671 RepID=UPI003B00C5E2
MLYTQSKLYGLEIISYCLMTNHVHLIVMPKNAELLSKAIENLGIFSLPLTILIKLHIFYLLKEFLWKTILIKSLN